MFECKGKDADGRCLSMPNLGIIRSDDICLLCGGKGLGDCRFMEFGRERPGCSSCFVVNCRNPESLVYGVIGPQLNKYCTASNCKYFEQD